jgi:probable rRNA maturation factor
MADIDFFSEGINQFKVPKPIRTRRWIRSVIRKEKRTLSHLNFIFCSDEYLLSINQQYLRHNTFTDIITFDNSEEPRTIEGDIFISVERVRENADTRQIAFEDELNRVMVHGVLHLIGYKDKSNDDKALMRKKEDAYLSLRIVSEK